MAKRILRLTLKEKETLERIILSYISQRYNVRQRQLDSNHPTMAKIFAQQAEVAQGLLEKVRAI